MAYIYKISNNINDKVYIGKTLYSIQRRWKQHLYNAKSRKDLQHMPLYFAMNVHGIEHFSISEVEQVKDYHLLSQRQKYWIIKFDSYNHGYNATKGGDGSLLYDYDYIWELWNEGLKIKDISKIVGCNDFVVRTVLDLYKIPTEERIQRSYEDQIASYVPYQKAVEQLDINTEQVLKQYSSLSEAAKAVAGDSSNISKVCKGINKTYHGYKWRYKDNITYINKNFSSRPVCKLDLKTGEIIETYLSISQAARSVKGDSSYISKVCRGKQHSSKGFGWCYLEAINSN